MTATAQADLLTTADAFPPPGPPRAALPAGLLCPRCGAAEFRTAWQQFRDGTRHVRVDCGAFVRYAKGQGLPEPRFEAAPQAAHAAQLAPPAADVQWVGLIRQLDQKWRPVALAPTLARCWDALLHFPGEGDRLAIPAKPARADGKEASP